MTRKEWARRMSVSAVVLLLTGLALLITGSVVAGSAQKTPMTGIAIGMVGVVMLTAGGLFWKFAIAGPYPKDVEADR